MSVLFLTNDLMFSSRVEGVAQSLEIDLSIVSDADQLLANASSNQVALVLLDLTMPGSDPEQTVARLRELECPPGAVVAFGPHVHEDTLAAAEDAGCDEVLARGAFSSQMSAILAKYTGNENTG